MCEKLENEVAILLNNNYLTQYHGNNVVFFSGIPENVPNNNLESTVISVMSDIEIEVEPMKGGGGVGGWGRMRGWNKDVLGGKKSKN